MTSTPPEPNTPLPHQALQRELEDLRDLLQPEPTAEPVDLETQLQQLQDEEQALNRQWLFEREERRLAQRGKLRKAIAMALFALAIIAFLKLSL